MSEAELHVLRARLIGGQLNKARRGELSMPTPLGYVVGPDGKLLLDPDEQVQGAVRLVFETFQRTGSAGMVVRYFREQEIAWPQRVSVGPRAGTFVTGALGHRGHPTPHYSCQRRSIERAESPCQRLPGAAIDRAVSKLVLETITPASIDVAVEVFDELRNRAAEIERAKRAQIARLREDAERAQRQFLLVRPENRLVADNLERHWNQALQRLAEAEESVRACRQDPVTAGHGRNEGTGDGAGRRLAARLG